MVGGRRIFLKKTHRGAFRCSRFVSAAELVGYSLLPCVWRLRKLQTKFLVGQVTKSVVSLGGVHENLRFVVLTPVKAPRKICPWASKSPELEPLQPPKRLQERQRASKAPSTHDLVEDH